MDQVCKSKKRSFKTVYSFKNFKTIYSLNESFVLRPVQASTKLDISLNMISDFELMAFSVLN